MLAARFLKEFRAIFMTSENEVKISKLDIHSSHHCAVCIALNTLVLFTRLYFFFPHSFDCFLKSESEILVKTISLWSGER